METELVLFTQAYLEHESKYLSLNELAIRFREFSGRDVDYRDCVRVLRKHPQFRIVSLMGRGRHVKFAKKSKTPKTLTVDQIFARLRNISREQTKLFKEEKKLREVLSSRLKNK